MVRGATLFQHIKESTAPAAFWWLGQATFLIKLGHTVMLIDPFLSPMEERRVPPLFRAEDAGIVDMVLCTHDHIDHIDPVAVPALAKHTQAKFVAPRAHAKRMSELGVSPDRLFAMNDGEQIAANNVTIHAIKSSHEFFEQTPDGLFPFLGYVIEGAGKTIYHPGDTVWWEGLQSRLSRWTFDAMLLPINGRDAVRLKSNCIGNMVYQEAADLAGGLNVKLTVPMHYDMFAFNAENPQLFVDYVNVKYPGRRVWAGQPTECVTF